MSDIKTIKVTESTRLRLSISEYKGKNYISMHQWYKTKKDPKFKPGKRNNIPLEITPKLILALKSLVKQAETDGLID